MYFIDNKVVLNKTYFIDIKILQVVQDGVKLKMIRYKIKEIIISSNKKCRLFLKCRHGFKSPVLKSGKKELNITSIFPDDFLFFIISGFCGLNPGFLKTCLI